MYKFYILFETVTNCSVLYGYMGFPSVSVVKNLPTNAEAIGTAGVTGSIPESPGERNDNPHSSILAGIIPWTEEPGGYSPRGHKESDMTEQLGTHAYLYIPHIIGP